ncbi:MAG: response regulator transcription factor [Verrucomicrobiales bacterium]|nr:response regulator transcription factor [Verrucomicrobiales bacterium]
MSTKNSHHQIYLIDDHPLMRAGMAKVIEMEDDLKICGEFGQGKGALDVVRKATPDVIILDISLKDSSGLELIKDFRAVGLNTPILVVSTHDEALYAERILKAGANGYLMKEEATDRLIGAIRCVLQGGIFLSDQMNTVMLKRFAGTRGVDSSEATLQRLTDREFEVFEMIGKGLPPRVIAGNLGISPKTVDAHRCNIKEKLAIKDGSELIRYAVSWIESAGV